MVRPVMTLELDERTRAYIAGIVSGPRSWTRDTFYGGVERIFQRHASIIAGSIGREVLTGGAGLRARSGNLAKSIVGDSGTYKGLPSFRVGVLRGPALAYAGVQEYGTKDKNPDSPYRRITPRKKDGALAMPTDEGGALTRAGVHRYATARDFPRALRFVPFRNGRIAIGALYEQKKYDRERKRARKSGDDFSLESLKAVYVLLRSVGIRPHYFLRDGMARGLPAVAEAVTEFVAKLIVQRGPGRA